MKNNRSLHRFHYDYLELESLFIFECLKSYAKAVKICSHPLNMCLLRQPAKLCYFSCVVTSTDQYFFTN